MQQRLELVDGKFIAVDKGVKEKAQEIKVQQRQYNLDVIALRDRVRAGNDKLFQAWLMTHKFTDDKERWTLEMDKWRAAQQKLCLLCSALKNMGYDDCLYIEDGKKTRSCINSSEGFWCVVCPSSIRYWEQELMDLPSPKR